MAYYEVKEKDWKLFVSLVPQWQEKYMEKLCDEYMALLNAIHEPSRRFWMLEKRINIDKNHPGVLINMKRSKMVEHLTVLLEDKVISFKDIKDFSNELKETLSKYNKPQNDEFEFVKIRLDFKYAEKGRFYRTVLVRKDLDLDLLGQLFVEVLGGTMEHCFLYETKEKQFIPQEWMDEFYMSERAEPYEIHTLDDLPDSFEFQYDTGDGWDFKCKKYAKTVIKKTNRYIFLLEGAGMGIWEDHIGSLYAYFFGEIDADFDGEDEERGIYKPWNFEIDKYSEFDNPLDIEELDEYISMFTDEDVDVE